VHNTLFDQTLGMLFPQLHQRRLEAVAILQEDGLPAHCVGLVREYFEDKHSGQWTGCRSDMV
jgi:hypothetical protein